MARRAPGGASQGQSPALTPGQRRRRRRLAEDLGRESFGNYARAWLRDHPKMGPRYRETCERNPRLHLVSLQDVPLRAMSSAVVRERHASALRGKGGRTSNLTTERGGRARHSQAGHWQAPRGARRKLRLRQALDR
jgi:hypothetical protein